VKTSKVVIDTNVLYAGLYSASDASHQILRMIDAGRVTPLLSTTLLFEYEDVLRRNRDILNFSVQDVDDVLDGLCSHAECRLIHFLWRPQLSDPKDDHILELAVAAGGAPIVTHNVKDFKGASQFAIRVIKPSKFLGELK